MMIKKIHTCHICNKPIRSLYRTEYVDGGKVFIHSYHPKKLSEEKVEEKKNKKDDLDKWYQQIYKVWNRVCAESGRPLSFDKKFCCHLLPKKDSGIIHNYSHFKTDLRNGILLSWNYHDILDKGSAEQRKSLKVWEYISMQRKLLLDEVGIQYDENYWLNMKV